MAQKTRQDVFRIQIRRRRRVRERSAEAKRARATSSSAPARVPRRPAAVPPSCRRVVRALQPAAALRLATPRRGGDYIRELSGRRSDQTCTVCGARPSWPGLRATGLESRRSMVQRSASMERFELLCGQWTMDAYSDPCGWRGRPAARRRPPASTLYVRVGFLGRGARGVDVLQPEFFRHRTPM